MHLSDLVDPSQIFPSPEQTSPPEPHTVEIVTDAAYSCVHLNDHRIACFPHRSVAEIVAKNLSAALSQ